VNDRSSPYESELSLSADLRHGQCIVHIDGGDVEVKYLVRWLDHDSGQFVVTLSDE
jgi:hypothetical protein